LQSKFTVQKTAPIEVEEPKETEAAKNIPESVKEKKVIIPPPTTNVTTFKPRGVMKSKINL
jgi:hypothetical protein